MFENLSCLLTRIKSILAAIHIFRRVNGSQQLLIQANQGSLALLKTCCKLSLSLSIVNLSHAQSKQSRNLAVLIGSFDYHLLFLRCLTGTTESSAFTRGGQQKSYDEILTDERNALSAAQIGKPGVRGHHQIRRDSYDIPIPVPYIFSTDICVYTFHIISF